VYPAINPISLLRRLSIASVNVDRLAPDLGHHVPDGVYEGIAAKNENLLTMRAGIIVPIEFVSVLGRRENYVASG
jgi:hypothetical protein